MAFIGGDMSNHRVRVFSTTFKEDIVRRLESGEALAAVSKEIGIARKLLYEWRWAWRRHGAAGLNRRRGPKKGLRRKMATGDPPGAALARAKARIEELERLVGRQQLDLDFFRKALRLADALQGPAPARGETNSSRSSKI
jgi:transposase